MCFRAVDELSKGVLTDNTRSFLNELKSRPQPPPMTATTILGTNEEVDYVNNACCCFQNQFYTLSKFFWQQALTNTAVYEHES